MLHAPCVSSDKVRKEMYNCTGYSPSEKASVYQQLLNEMRKAIADGGNLVLDATFSDSRIRQTFQEEATGKAAVQFIEITADEWVIRERLKEKRLFSDADFEVYLKLKQDWHALEMPHLTLRSTQDNINELLNQAKIYFGIKG